MMRGENHWIIVFKCVWHQLYLAFTSKYTIHKFLPFRVYLVVCKIHNWIKSIAFKHSAIKVTIRTFRNRYPHFKLINTLTSFQRNQKYSFWTTCIENSFWHFVTIFWYYSQRDIRWCYFFKLVLLDIASQRIKWNVNNNLGLGTIINDVDF